MPVRAVKGEDASSLVPGYADVAPGTSGSVRCCGPTGGWLEVEQGTLGPCVVDTSA
jgi:hypothetical protein